MTVADHVLTAIEKTLLKSFAVYLYTEVLPRVFYIQLEKVGAMSIFFRKSQYDVW